MSTERGPGWRRLLWPHLRPQLGALSLALILALLIAALAAAQPLLTRALIDQGLIGRHYGRLLAACGAMLAVVVLGMALGAVHRSIYVRASGRALFALRGAVFAHLLKVSPRRLARLPSGDLLSRLDGDIAEVQRFGIDAASGLVSSVLSLLAVFAVMFGLSWRLSLIVLVLLPLQLWVRHHARPRIEASSRTLRESAARLSSFFVETLTGVRAVQAAAAEPLESQRLAHLGEAYLERVRAQQLVAYGTGALAALFGHLVTLTTFVLGGWYVLEGELSVGTLIAFVGYFGRSAGSAAAVTGLYTAYQRARVSLVRVEELLALPIVSEPPQALAIADEAPGAIRFESVTVLDEGGRAVLDALSAHLPGGSKTVLHGASGAGKSTLADLLRRFIEPDAGRILLDGQLLEAYRLAELRRRIVVLESDPQLRHGSILDNLRYGAHASRCEEAQLLEAARAAGVEEFVGDLARRYATRIGEGGAGLSTGQRQRIAIARALLARPLVLVLDEALGGLDLAAARELERLLDETFPRVTRILITHREGEAEARDRTLRLADGRLKEIAP